jgi:ABC-2 type transport system permease protein
MRNFLIQAYSTYKGLFYWLNWSGYITNVFLRPIVVVIMFSLLGRFALNPEAARDYALGVTAYSMVFILLGGITQGFTYDRNLGTIQFLYTSPANRLINFLSRPVFHYPNALLVFTASMTTAWLVVGIDFGPVNWAGFITAIIVTAATIAAFGQFLGIFTIIFRDWLNVFGFSIGILLALTGVIIPISVFPSGIEELTKLLPLTNGLMAIRETFIGASLSSVSTHIIRDALTGLVFLTIGFLCFRLFEHIAIRKGTLDIEDF